MRERTKRNFSKSEKKTKEKMLRIYMFRTSEKKLEKQQQLKTTKSLFYFVFVIFRHEEISLIYFLSLLIHMIMMTIASHIELECRVEERESAQCYIHVYT